MTEFMFRPLAKYLDFSGRAQRAEYWWFGLFCLVASLVLGLVDGMLGTTIAGGTIGLLGALFALAIFMPSLAVAVRRLHDRDQSGWWVLLAFIPIAGAIVLLIWYCLDGTPGPNRFGPDPKGRA